MIEEQLINTADRFFSQNVVNEIIEPTVRDIVRGARGEVVSLGFVISLWAGSSAVSAFVDSITEAHDQTPLRHPVRQRFFALGLYVVMLVLAIATAPFVALGPLKIGEHIPESWDNFLRYGYYPLLILGLTVSVTFLYRVSLPKPLPSHRLVLGAVLATLVFLVTTVGLRIYLTYITSTGYTYGALATPIAFLLFAFFLGFAIMIGRRVERRRRRGVARAGHPRQAVPVVAGGEGCRVAASHSTAVRSRRPKRPRPRRPRATPLLLELLVDPLAVRAHRRTGLRRLRHRKHFAAQRDDVRTHDGAFGDLVLLDVVEELRGVAVGPVVDAFVGVGALDRLGLAWVHCARQYIGKKPIGLTGRECGTVEV